MALTTLFQSILNNASVVTCACRAARYVLPNISTDIQPILFERLHTAIISCISKYYPTEQEICYDLLLHVLPQFWKINSSLCKTAIADTVFVELLSSKLNILVENENHVHAILPYAVLLSKHLEYWKAIIPGLELAGVHRTFRAIFRSYNLLSVEQLCDVLDVLCNFANPDGTGSIVGLALADQYISEDMQTYLIIVIQEYTSNLNVQRLVWKLMKLLCESLHKFAYALIHTGILHCASSLLMEDSSSSLQLKQYTIEFLSIIPASFGDFNSFFFQVPNLVESIAQLVKNQTLEEEYMLMSCRIISGLTTKMSTSLLPEILNLHILETFKHRALQSPEKYLILVCEMLGNIVSCGKSHVFGGESNLPNTVFQDHYLFYQEVLSTESITSSAEHTAVILQSLNQFVRSLPRNLFEETLCTKPFIEPLLSLFETCKDSMVMYLITTLLHLLFCLVRGYENGAKVVHECNAHVALAKAFTKSFNSSLAEELLGVFLYLFILYNSNKTAEALIDVSLHKAIVNVAKKFGRFQCQKLAEEYGRCILTITADKEFSKKLVSVNYVDDLNPLISESYCAPIFKASLHAQGNLAICGTDVKVKLINEDELHLRLISYIREHTIDGNAGVLSACCRVLHILASGDGAKRLFIDIGCIEVLLRLLKLRTENPELCWRPLGTLSSLGFTALCNRHAFIRQNIIKTVCSIIRGSSADKSKGYASLILICICEREDGVCLVRNSGIMEDLVNIIAASSNEELNRWGSIVVEKLSLYTVEMPQETVDQDKDSPDNGMQGISCAVDGADFPSHGTDNLQHRSPKLDPRIKPCIGNKMPDDSFCVGRMFGSTHGMCSNCESDGASAELVMRVHDMSPMQYQHLIDNGWYRRGGVKMFRLRENHNMKCCDWETRVEAQKFDFSKKKSYRKVLRKIPSNISIKTLPAYYNKESFDLYNSYHVSKHDKPVKSVHSYTEHVVYSPYRQQEGKGGIVYGTYHQEYYFGDKLVGVGVIDVVPNGVVSVYMWYDNSKEVNKYSLGVYSALKEIEYVCSLAARNPDIKYYYLQGWNPQNQKLSYKATYPPVEFFCPCISTEWTPDISGVNECIDNKLKAAEAEIKDPAVNHSLTSSLVAPIPQTVSSYEVGVTPYEAHHGPIDVNAIPVCLDLTQFNNGDTHSFMTLGEAIILYQIKEYQVEMMKKRYKELIVALGQPLAKQFYIVLKVCRQTLETSV